MATHQFDPPTQATEEPPPPNNPASTPVYGFMWFTFVVFLFTLIWTFYVLRRLQRDGAIEYWSLPPADREEKRKMDRERVIGIRRVWIAGREHISTVFHKEGEENSDEGHELDERVRLARMHTVRRQHQNYKAEKKRALLREIERVKAERHEDTITTPAENNPFDYGDGSKEIDIKAQTQQQAQSREAFEREKAKRVQASQDRIDELDKSPSDVEISSPTSKDLNEKALPETPRIPLDDSTVFNSQSTRARSTRPRLDENTFTHPTLTNKTFNTPPSPPPVTRRVTFRDLGTPTPQPRQHTRTPFPFPAQQRPNNRISTATWEYNDSDDDEESANSEDPFSLLVRRAQEFENGHPAPRVTNFLRSIQVEPRVEEQHVNDFARGLPAVNRVSERQLGAECVIEMPGAVHLPQEGRGGRRGVRGDDVFVVGEDQEIERRD